jgi:hypothetical protein
LKPRGRPAVYHATFIAAMPPEEAPTQQRFIGSAEILCSASTWRVTI